MKTLSDTLEFATRGDGDVKDLTPALAESLKAAGLREGVVTVFVPGSTAGVTTIEHEPGVEADFAAMMERLAPRGLEYGHDRRWGDGNGFSHVRAALVGASLSVPFSAGRLCLGEWQQVVFLDFDNRPRRRSVVLQLTGE